MNVTDASAGGLRARFRVDRDVFVLDVDLSLPDRGVIALFGPSGSGKTTVLRAIAGLERVSGGTISVGDDVWQDDSRGIFVPVHRRALGYVFQEANLFPHLTVRANLDYGQRRAARRGNAADSREEIVALLGIESLLDRSPQNLSGGERQRVAIARALLARPRLLLLDEPLASIDYERKGEILPYLERLLTELKIPMIYVSHAFDEIARLADHLVLLSGGRVVASGPIAEVMTRVDLPENFSRDAGVVIEGRVAACDSSYGLVRLDFAGGSLQVSHPLLPLGQRLRVQVLSRDVSLALEQPRGTSVLNVLPAKIVRVTVSENPAHVLVLLDVGGAPLVARITRLSSDRLHLAPDVAVWAQIKSVAVLS